MELKNIYAPIEKDLAAVDAEIRKQLGDLTGNHEFVKEIVDCFFDSPGQKLRPALVILSARAALEKSMGFDAGLIKLAAIVELIHSASLIHDDVVDESLTRRGKPCLNVQFGNKTAVLAGDMLYSHAFAMLTESFDKNIMKILSRCVQKMCRGEINELRSCDFEQYLEILEDKTASFMSACCRAGAAHALKDDKAKQAGALGEFGLNIGMVYQLVDDLKDADTPFAVSGSYREKVISRLNEYIEKTEKNLSLLKASPYLESLTGLVRYIIKQQNEIPEKSAVPATA